MSFVLVIIFVFLSVSELIVLCLMADAFMLNDEMKVDRLVREIDCLIWVLFEVLRWTILPKFPFFLIDECNEGIFIYVIIEMAVACSSSN